MAAYYVQSLFIFFAIFFLLGGLAASVYFSRLDSSARYWVAGALLTGATALATVFRGELPLFWSYSVPIGLSGTSNMLLGLGIARLYNKGPQLGRLLWLVLGTLVYIAVMEWCRIHEGPEVTLLLSGGWIGATSLWGAYFAHVHYKLSSNRFSMHMRWVMIGLGTLHLLRTKGFVTGWGLNIFGQEAWTFGIFTVIFVVGMLRYFAYFGIRIQEQASEKLNVTTALVREEEGRRLSQRLAQKERQHGLDLMSASFAHELNQPLTVIRNYAELLQDQLRSGTLEKGMANGVLKEIIDSNTRAAEIIRRIRNFIQPTQPRKENIDLREVVHEVLALVAPEVLRLNIELVKPTMPNPVWLRADAIELSQVLFNVLRNAMDALQSADKRCIELELIESEGEVQLRVYDSGTVLPDSTLVQAGEPFFTTKASGLGMGLSISKSILAQYGGRLSLSNTARGTCALVSLPLTEQQ